MARQSRPRDMVYGKRRTLTSAHSIVARWTREEMRISSISQLDTEEREVFNRMVNMIASGEYDATWNGPHAMWLDMVGLRPMATRVDVDSRDSTSRMQGRVREWREFV